MSSIHLPARADDAEFHLLVDQARSRLYEPNEVAALARHLASSGEQLDWPGQVIGDVASTGGPGSLSTLVAPLALRAEGVSVVKLGVPGRPAGAIDSLATLPGYRARSSSAQVRECIARCGYAHFLADERFAPLDAALFDYRKRTKNVAIPSLAAASLLAKKVAVGVRYVGLDIRVGAHGNFGTSIDEARVNAKLFCDTARLLNIQATAFISVGAAPAQPWIGRGESLLALSLAVGLLEEGGPNSWLDSHIHECRRMAQCTLAAGDMDANKSDVRAVLRAELQAHLESQGSSIELLRDRAEQLLAASRTTIASETNGIVTFDLNAIRDALVDVQNSGVGFRDPAGIELLVQTGTFVSTGQALARVRCDDAVSYSLVCARLNAAIHVTPTACQYSSELSMSLPVMEVVRA